MQPKENIAARAGRWSANHRKRVIVGWLAFVVLAFMAGQMTGTKQLTNQESGVGESGRADQALYDAFPKQASESVLVQSKTLKATDTQFKDTVADVKKRVSAVAHVSEIESNTVSRDGHSVLVNMKLKGDTKETKTRIDALLASVKDAEKANPGFRVEQFGDASSNKAIMDSQKEDFQKAEVSSLPLTLIILVFAFGALAAAGVPVLLAITAVMATLGLIGPLSQVIPVDANVQQVVLLIGLAVGVDYALFYIRREREERAAGRSEEAALQAAAATSGRAVLISGVTVMVAMGGMYFAGAQTFSSFATGTILVVAVAMLASLTVLPAILSVLGDRINKGRIPFLAKRRERRATEGSGLWTAFLDRVLRRPLLSALLAGGVLVALTVPAFGLHTEVAGVDSLSRDLPVMQTYDRIQEAFPGKSISATVVVEAEDVTSPQVKAAIGELQEQAVRSDHLQAPVSVDLSPDKSVANVAIAIDGDGTDEDSQAGLRDLREVVVPATVGEVGGVEANVGGMTAGTSDFNDTMKSNVIYVFAFVLSLAFLLLLVTFRSIVIPVKAILLNLLSVGAAYGVLVLVFQNGWGESLLGFESTGSIAAWLPLFLFVILFGLSMDYHVFILTRIREAFDRGMTTEQAVHHGIKTTAGTVTSAAVVMVGVFAIFATMSDVSMKQMGIGLAAAVLIDATIIRAVLLPATMKLLGDRNWWLPSKLGWLPKVTPEREAGAPLKA